MLAISHFSPKKIELILDQALEMANGKKYAAQDEIFVSNLFFEDSTRTKISFEMAERKLGLSVIPFDTSQSSVNKGESLYDTAKTLESIGLNLLVIRHGQNQYYDELKNIKIPIINAGDGTGNHPSQTMLDLMTIKQEFGSFKDLKIAIAGDVKHSRVANSACDILRKLGAKVYLPRNRWTNSRNRCPHAPKNTARKTSPKNKIFSRRIPEKIWAYQRARKENEAQRHHHASRTCK